MFGENLPRHQRRPSLDGKPAGRGSRDMEYSQKRGAPCILFRGNFEKFTLKNPVLMPFQVCKIIENPNIL